MTEYALSPEQIKWYDEILAEERSAKATLEIALQYHANTSTRIQKDFSALWTEIKATSGLPVFETRYKISQVRGRMVVTEDTGEDQNETD